MPDGAPVLEVDGVHTYYGKQHILHGCSLAVGAGEIVSLLGRNGVGKTTLARTITGLTPARDGAIRLSGEQISGLAPHEVARRKVSLVPQGRRIFAELTVLENLRLAERRGGERWTRERIYELFPRLQERQRQRAGLLSGGEQQMLAIGRALIADPRLVVMDEPSEGLAPLVVARVAEALREIRRDGTPVLLIEQRFAMALELCDRAYVMARGQNVFEGTAEQLIASPEITQQYLAAGGTGKRPAGASEPPASAAPESSP